MNPSLMQQTLAALRERAGQVVFSAEESLRLTLIAMAVRGHVLLEGVPGTGKTLLALSFARCLGLELRRIQCTPDLMPGDVLGANIFDFRTQTFNLTKGPVFADFLLVDEINRTPPKTQSALLEAMQERSVTIDGVTHRLPDHFVVMATQNPVEQEGTYPLPEAQLDRFLFKVQVGYPNEADELRAVTAHCTSAGMPDLDRFGLKAFLTPEHITAIQQIPGTVRVDASIVQYVVALGRATRQHPSFSVGLSPRALTMLTAAARAAAACEARDYVVPDDVKSLFVAAARHRVMLATAAEMEGITPDTVLAEIVNQVQAPR